MDGFSIMRRAPSWILFHSGEPAELSLLYSDDSFIIRPFIQILNLNGYFCFTHKDTGTSLCAFDIFHVLVLSKISWPVLLSEWFSPFLYCVCEGICSWQKKKISNVFRRLFIPTLSSPLAPGGDGSAPNVHPRASFQQRPLWWQVHSHKHYPV